MSGYDSCVSTCYYCCELENDELYCNCNCCVVTNGHNKHKWYYCCFNVHGSDFLKWIYDNHNNCLIFAIIFVFLAFLCRIILTVILILFALPLVIVLLPLLIISCPLWFPLVIIIMFFSWFLSILYSNDPDVWFCCKFLCMMFCTRKSSA